MKNYKTLVEDLWDDLQKKIIAKGEVYEIISPVIMLSKWGGIRKTVAPHIRVITERNKVYMMRWDVKKKEVPPKSVMESTELKIWKKIVADKEVKKI